MSKPTPPRLACWLLRLRLSKSRYECIAGDLFEEYASGSRSDAWFWSQTWSAMTARSVRVNQPKAKVGNPMNLVSGFPHDLKYAARTLRKSPGFTAVAVLALGFGIGVNTTIFTVLNAIALRPLPVRDAGDVVGIYQTFRGSESRNVHGFESYFSYPEYQQYRDQNSSLSGLTGAALVNASLGGTAPRHVAGQMVTCNFFEVMGRQPALGRGFAKDECDTPDSAAVVVLAHDFWTSQYHADPGFIGRTIILNRRAFTVIGVAPRDFPGSSFVPAGFWAPVTMQAVLMPGGNYIEDSNLSWLEMAGRLKPGASLSQARADLAVIADRIDQLHPKRRTTLSVNVATLLGDPEKRTVVFAGGAVALAAVGLVLMIACANVANLLLARAAARQKEISIRLASGASRWRLIRQLLTESLLISALGGALGVVLAVWTSRALTVWILANVPGDIPGVALNMGLDVRVLGYATLISSLTSLAFGLVPAIQATRVDLNAALKEDGAGVAGASASKSWLRGALVGIQVSVCLILLVAAGLLMRGLQAAQNVDPGFTAKDTLAVTFDLKSQGYDDARAAVFHRQLNQLVSAQPGVDGISLASVIPLSGSSRGEPVDLGGSRRSEQIWLNDVSPGFFSVLGIPIVRGRGFTEAETRSKKDPTVAVVTELTARRFWPGEDPLGKQIRLSPTAVIEVVGVARDARTTSLSAIDKAYVYFPVTEAGQNRLSLLIHSSAGTSEVAHQVRKAAASLDSAVIVTTKPLQENIEFWSKTPQLLALTAAAMGLVGLLLASIGIYGVVSYGVNRRIREIGIRITLGAETGAILMLIVKQGMRPVFIGLAVGFAVSAGITRLMTFLLFGVSPMDPLTFASVSLFLAGSALLACYMPARRATRVDPVVALRNE